MRNFIKKYIRSFKKVKSRQKPKILKPSKKVVNVFCDGKELISNQDLHDNTLKILYNILNPASAWWNRFANGTLELNGNDIDYYHNMAENYAYLCAMYFSLDKPDEDTRNFYFKRLDDLSNTNSYPTLPAPPQSAYPGWVKGNNKVHINSIPNNPFCVEVPGDPFNVLANNFTAEDINTARPNLYPSGPNPGTGDVITNYSRPGFTNIFFEKGFSVNNDLVKLQGSQYPNLDIFDGNTPDPNNPQQNYPKRSYRQWMTSGSDYRDENANLQSTTPYQPYSYKDLVYRLKSNATNPKTLGAVSALNAFNYRLRLNFNHPIAGGPAYELVLIEYNAAFIGVDVDMTPHEVYNHCQNILFTSDWEIPNTPLSYSSVQPSIIPLQTPPPGYQNVYDPSLPWYTPSTPIASGSYLSGYYYAQNSINGLPSGRIFSFQQKMRDIGRIGMHNHGVENCTGCTAGCFYNWKLDDVHCTDNNNQAWPFKSVDDCENYLSLYDSPCPKNPPIFDDGETPKDDNGSVVPIGVKQVWKCDNAIGECSYQGTIPVSQNMPPNTYRSLALCQNSCKCLSDCCKKNYISNPSNSTNFCTSEFRLIHSPTYYPGGLTPSNFQSYPNNKLSVGTTLRWRRCAGSNIEEKGQIIERYDVGSSTWQFFAASDMSNSSSYSGTDYTGLPGGILNVILFRVSIFANNVSPKPGVVLQPLNYPNASPLITSIITANLVEQSYLKVRYTGTAPLPDTQGNLVAIYEEIPLTYLDESSVKFPSCVGELDQIDDVDV